MERRLTTCNNKIKAVDEEVSVFRFIFVFLSNNYVPDTCIPQSTSIHVVTQTWTVWLLHSFQVSTNHTLNGEQLHTAENEVSLQSWHTMFTMTSFMLYLQCRLHNWTRTRSSRDKNCSNLRSRLPKFAHRLELFLGVWTRVRQTYDNHCCLLRHL